MDIAEKGKVVLVNKEGKEVYDSKIIDLMILKVTDNVGVTMPKMISTIDTL